MNNNIIDVNINDITIGKRIRKEMGDLKPLARTIEETGLLRPIGITADYELVFGERSLLAARDILKRQTISARIVEVNSTFLGQITENLVQKTYTPSERVAIVDAVRSYKHGGDRKSDQARKCEVENLTVDQAAKRAGLGGKDGYNRAKAVVENGIPELVQAMDSDTLSIAAASKLAGLEPDQQRRVLEKGSDHTIWFVNRISKRQNSKSTPEYSTPPWLFDHLNEEFHFTLDAAALPETAKCARFFTPQDDGLSHSWAGEVVWLNPPFSNREIEAWVRKAYEESRAGATVVMLIPSNYKGYRWWKENCTQGEVRFIHDYVRFPRYGEKNSACVDVTVVILGPQFKPWSSGPLISKTRIERLGATASSARLSALPANEPQPTVAMRPPIVNAVTQGDCRHLIPLLPDEAINLCLCSPPYADQRKGEYPGVPERDYPQFTVDWMGKLWPKLTDDGSVLIVIDPHVKAGVLADYVLRTQLALRESGWKEHQTQIWYKRDRGPLGHREWPRHSYENILWLSKTSKPFCDPVACGKPCKNLSIRRIRHSKWSPGDRPKKPGIARVSDVIDVPVGGNEKGIGHSAMFPPALAKRLIQTFCPPGGMVLDNFAGSGSTLVAAKRLGHDFYGIEIEGKFCEIARSRLAETTVQLPIAG